MDRRWFIGTLTGGLLAAPLTAEAQQPGKAYRIGILSNVPLSDAGGARLWGEFIRGLRDQGYVDGQNIVIEHLSSAGQYDRLPTLAAELVRHKADVIVAPAAQNVVAAKQASATIPIVMVGVGDPLADGLIASLPKPGGNVAGTSFLTSAVISKQLEFLRQLVPRSTRLAVLLNPANPSHPRGFEQARTAARPLGVAVHAVEARGPDDLERAFVAASRAGTTGLLVPWDGMFLLHRARIAQLAAKTQLPTLYGQSEFIHAGGLACYGPSGSESFRGAAAYVAKILKGAKPADLPVEQPTKFELVINLKTAKALGLTIPQSLLQRADQVIE